MADLRLGGFGQGSTQTTLDRLNERSFTRLSQEGTKAQGYQELKAYVSQFGANATLRGKNSNSHRSWSSGSRGPLRDCLKAIAVNCPPTLSLDWFKRTLVCPEPIIF